eukprot:scaffold126424_cov48-Phaeocystis_antarctica.AAC.2
MEVGKNVTSSPRPRRMWTTYGCSPDHIRPGHIRLQPGVHRHRVASPRRGRRRKYGSSSMLLTTYYVLAPHSLDYELHPVEKQVLTTYLLLRTCNYVLVTNYLQRTCSLRRWRSRCAPSPPRARWWASAARAGA